MPGLFKGSLNLPAKKLSITVTDVTSYPCRFSVKVCLWFMAFILHVTLNSIPVKLSTVILSMPRDSVLRD